MIKRSLTLIIFSLVTIWSKAQLSGDFSIGAGNNYASSGQYVKFAGQSSYKYAQWNFLAAMGTVFSKARNNMLDALQLSISRDCVLKDKTIEANIFYQRSPFSFRLNEHNAGVLLKHKGNHWYFNLGMNTRIFKLTNKYARTHSYSEKSLWEPINVMYKVTYHQPIGKKLELNASVTNFDKFIIEQETNPFVIIDFKYRIRKRTKIYFDAAYQQAGFFNIRVNYFGYYARVGCQFDIGKGQQINK